MKPNSIYLLLSILLITFTSCSKDDNSNDTEKQLTEIPTGKWQLEKYSKPDKYEPCNYKRWVSFNGDGTYSEYDECRESTIQGTWVKNGNVLTVTENTVAVPWVFKIISLTQTSLVLSINAFGETEEVTYKKI